ncbi:cation:proton antiporter subunit C [Candidatus Mesenet endosymbiont of Phosphuga atrata]|uniref:cation:proton antiporter subunit C n=1 Tax=Candidatus Mesenet endosymbiont of Phosphuga atrata TaxID=3066221 RepID=UPI0030CE1628
MTFVGMYHYAAVAILMTLGLYTIISNKNLVKKLFGISIFQTSALLLYISLGYVKNSYPPILQQNVTNYSNPLPHVLMLTAIVVGIATFAVGLSIAVKIKECK